MNERCFSRVEDEEQDFFCGGPGGSFVGKGDCALAQAYLCSAVASCARSELRKLETGD